MCDCECKNECEFKYLDEVEVSNEYDFIKSYICCFITKHPNGGFIVHGGDGYKGYNYCRKPRPNLKLGHPVFAKDVGKSNYNLFLFVRFSERGIIVVERPCDIGRPGQEMHWDEYKLIENYDYSKDPVLPE